MNVLLDERQAKHRRVAAFLATNDLDAVVLSRRCNFSWYTCGAHNYVGPCCDQGNSWLLVTRDAATVLTNNIEAPRLRAEELAESGMEIVEFAYHDAAEAARTFARATGSMAVAADAPAPGLDAPTLGRDFDQLRWVLTGGEIERYRTLILDVAEGTEAVARSAQPGRRENQLAGALSAEMFNRGCACWTLLVGADHRLDRFRHPLPGDSRVRKRFMLAVGAERDGLIASCSRLASFGPLDESTREKMRAVATVDAAMISATRPGATLGEIFDVAREAYEQVGWRDQWKLHHQGGSCGYLPRDVKAAPGDQTAVPADQAFAWNPSLPGAKSEDTILCRTDGPEIPSLQTDWPRIEVEWRGIRLARPDMLER